MVKIKLTHLIYLYFLFFPITAYSSMYENLTIDEVVNESELVFEGKVVNLEYKTPSDRNRVYTFVTFEINDVIKGKYVDKTIEIRYPGGIKGDQVTSVTDMVIPQVGEEGIYFIKSLTKHYIHPLTGWAQGQMNIVTDKVGKKRVFSVSGESISHVNRLGPKRKGVEQNLSADVASGIQTSKQKDQAMLLDEVKSQLKQIVDMEEGK
ncbi:MAG: hypothetical protein L3J59_08600 [Methylococcaceae bacterium]|nr:hypothetical protein [Methylococcaceae bacterium]